MTGLSRFGLWTQPWTDRAHRLAGGAGHPLQVVYGKLMPRPTVRFTEWDNFNIFASLSSRDRIQIASMDDSIMSHHVASITKLNVVISDRFHWFNVIMAGDMNMLAIKLSEVMHRLASLPVERYDEVLDMVSVHFGSEQGPISPRTTKRSALLGPVTRRAGPLERCSAEYSRFS